jgi:hypothetical protein
MHLRAAWAGAVIATALIALLSGSVFVLAQVFGSEPSAPQSPSTTTSVTPSTTPVWKEKSATVVGVRGGRKNPRAVVMVVALPTGAPGCARNLHARVTQEDDSTLAVQTTMQTLRDSCRVVSRTIAATARAPLADRRILVNGEAWTRNPNGGYRRCPTTDCD